MHNYLLQVQGHEPHPGQHINIAFTNETKLIIPERPMIHIRAMLIPGIIFTSHT